MNRQILKRSDLRSDLGRMDGEANLGLFVDGLARNDENETCLRLDVVEFDQSDSGPAGLTREDR